MSSPPCERRRRFPSRARHRRGPGHRPRYRPTRSPPTVIGSRCAREPRRLSAPPPISRLAKPTRGVRIDVSQPSELRGFVESALDRFGRIDALVSNAGVNRAGALLDMTVEDFDDIFATNVRGTFFAAQAVAPEMIAQRSGAIVNVASFVAAPAGAALHRVLSLQGSCGLTHARSRARAGRAQRQRERRLPRQVLDRHLGAPRPLSSTRTTGMTAQESSTGRSRSSRSADRKPAPRSARPSCSCVRTPRGTSRAKPST